ncbi:hypothetical protein M0208_01435 [Sphingomonas sp. SUN019]|uniref:hypothetical protein n=1 Tax=Sphingomonas sp. SUN019 TaxID=2937788 RepID=UPI00216402BF|nr:hypothetical protein [Sphingomonas sp. SUN019]UVO49243.1 hypothetical protein M0208_01435 [Sphingomonas sp. SUN019]
MLDVSALKDWLHRGLPSRDKLLLTLASIDQPAKLADLRSRSEEAGFKLPKKWNLSDVLGKSGGLAIRVPAGWELTDAGKNYLRALGVESANGAAVQIAADLRKHLANVQNATTRAFVEEAIKCYESKLYRSAIVMSWIAAVDVLYREVVANHLDAFNTEAKRVSDKWKKAANADGLSRMGEADFLDRLVAINVIGKNVKDQLAIALNLRNGCGHPNSLAVGGNMVTSHLETLLLNVFERFSA